MIPEFLHLDEAKRNAISRLEALLEQELDGVRIVLVDDLFGELRLAIWPAPGSDVDALAVQLDRELRQVAGKAWSGTIWIDRETGSVSDRVLLNAAWEESTPYSERFRVLERVRTRTGWFESPRDPPWSLSAEEIQGRSGPPIVAFCSFKGGVGRTTGLASFAIARARAGERVFVIDLDLDAPGIGTMLDSRVDETDVRWGVVDYLLERGRGNVPLADYIGLAQPVLASPGSIEVMGAGVVNDDYLMKLARLDLEVPSTGESHPLTELFDDVRKERQPDWILVDARAGLNSVAGLLLSGCAHMYVIFATHNPQTDAGLSRFLVRLGADRLHADPPKVQANVAIVHAMVPEDVRAAALVEGEFVARLEKALTDHYFARASDDPDDQFWSVADLDTQDAPNHPIAIPYSPRLATYRSLDDVIDVLLEAAPYRVLRERIESLVPRTPDPELHEAER